MVRFSHLRSFLICAGVLALTAGWNLGARPTLSAQSPATDGVLDPALVSAFKWRSVGPDRGGRSIAVSGVKGRPREAYFGAAGGGGPGVPSGTGAVSSRCMSAVKRAHSLSLAMNRPE